MELTEIQNPPPDMKPSWAVWIQTHFRELFSAVRQLLIGIYVDEDGVTYIGDGGVANYTKIDTDGEITLHGTAMVKRHIRIGAGSWKPGATAPTAGFTGVFPHLSFANGADEQAHYAIIVPHRRAAGTDMTLRLFWYYTGGNDNTDCEWNLTYSAVKPGEDPTGAGTAHAEVFTAIATDDTLGITDFTIPGGALENHDDLGLKIWRDGSDALSAAAILIMVHLEFTKDKLGEAT